MIAAALSLRLLSVTAAAIAVSAPPVQAQRTSATAESKKAYDAFPPPGATMAIVDRSGVKFVSWGNEHVGGAKSSSATVYQIASLTKPFTAIVILRLVETGRLRLDDPAMRWVDWLPSNYAGVTVRQLLTHTSGVPRDLRRQNVDEFGLDEFRTRFLAAEPSFTPGTKWEYSNTGYILLSLIAEKAGGRSFGTMLQDFVFRPAGMTASRYRAPLKAGRGRAVGYDWQEGMWREAPPVYGGYGNAGMESTAPDLARFAGALRSHRLLQPRSLTAMMSPARLADGSAVSFPFRGVPSSYGLGWFLSDFCGRRVALHGGTIAGYSANLSWTLDDPFAIIVLANGKSGADRIGIADNIATAGLRADLRCP